MKKCNILLFFILIFHQATYAYCQNIPRHIDPSSLEAENPNPVALFRLYSDIYHLISTSDYEQAMKILGSLEDLKAPDQTQLILSEYNELLRDVIDNLNITEISLFKAYSHLEWLRETEAADSLNEAAPRLYSANTSSITLESRSHTISNIFKSSPQVLLESQAELERFISNLEKRLLEGYERVEEISSAKNEGLSETTIQLDVDENNPWVGSAVIIYGSLYDDSGVALLGKDIIILINGKTEKIETDIHGNFQYKFITPYVYNNEIQIRATFWPGVEEIRTYSPTFRSIVLHPKFHKPSIEFYVPETVFPGVQYKIEGKIVHSGPSTALEVSIDVFDEIYQVSSNESGEFLFYLNVPESAVTGVNKIIFYVNPIGLIGHGTLSGSLLVEKLSLSVEVDSPLFLVSGQKISLSGTVFVHNKPLSLSEVNVSIGANAYSTKTGSNGRFTSTLPIEVMTPSKKLIYTITINPIEPWIEEQTVKSDFWVLNSLTIAFTLVTVGMIIKNRRKVDNGESQSEEDVISVMEEELSVKEGHPSLYSRALVVIGKLTGEMISQSQTVREFLEKIRPKLIQPLFRLFSELSLLYERWLYGGSKQRPNVEESQVIVERMEDEFE